MHFSTPTLILGCWVFTLDLIFFLPVFFVEPRELEEPLPIFAVPGLYWVLSLLNALVVILITWERYSK